MAAGIHKVFQGRHSPQYTGVLAADQRPGKGPSRAVFRRSDRFTSNGSGA